MRTRHSSLVAAAIGLALVVSGALVSPTHAAPAGTVTTGGWTWQVLSGENDLFGTVAPPATTSIAGLGVASSAPALRAPSIPMLYSLFSDSRWTYGSVVIDQDAFDGPATVAAVLSGPGGNVDVIAELDGGTVEYTLSWTTPLSTLVGVDVDPLADGYTDGVLNSTVEGTTVSEIGGWVAGSSTHHSAAWALDQLEGDPQTGWVVFVTAADAPVDVTAPAVAPATTSDLTRALIFADGPTGLETPADTWIVRMTLVGGAGCAADPASLATLAETLTNGVAAGSTASSTGCLTLDPVEGMLGDPLDVLLPIELDPALATTAWWADRSGLALRAGALPSGLSAELVIVNDEPALRIVGVPDQSGSTVVPVVIGLPDGAGGDGLLDAVGGEVTITIVPALAATGADERFSSILAIAALGLITLGAVAVALPARRRRPRVG